MKVIKKPTIPMQTCQYCGAVLQVGLRDLRTDGYTASKTRFDCKVCKGSNVVKFKEM